MDNNELTNIENVEVKAEYARFCYDCYAPLDVNKACTNVDCAIYGIPQE